MIYPFIRMDGLMNTAAHTVSPTASVLDRMATLGDPIRCRALDLLERRELTVSEITSVLQLPQSTVSRHLKVLADDGWLEARKDGTSRRYSARSLSPELPAARLWSLVREDLANQPAAREDRRRLESVLARRRSRSKEFFASTAGGWSDLRRDLFGHRFDLEALLGLLDDRWVVGDLGAGDGLLANTLAPCVARVLAVDDSPEMLDAAARRLSRIDNVELRHGRLEELPIEDAALDVAILALVLHHLPDPEAVIREAARALGPGGKLLVVDMALHEREEYRHEMGHVWLGFDSDQIAAWTAAAGLDRLRLRHLRPEPEAQGPSLFCATAVKSS